LFASHPDTRERIDKIRQLSAAQRATATVEARYKSSIPYEPLPITSIATVTEGSAGLTGSTKPDDKAAKEAPKKKGFGLGSLTQAAAPEKQSAQVSASGGARGLGPDRLAKGGANPAFVRVSVTAEEIERFKKGIA
jgi:hypothetical protein